MNIWAFSLYTSLGALLWNGILAGLGWWLAQHVTLSQLYEAVEKYNSYLTMAGFALLALCILYIVWHAFRKKK